LPLAELVVLAELSVDECLERGVGGVLVRENADVVLQWSLRVHEASHCCFFRATRLVWPDGLLNYHFPDVAAVTKVRRFVVRRFAPDFESILPFGAFCVVCFNDLGCVVGWLRALPEHYAPKW